MSDLSEEIRNITAEGFDLVPVPPDYSDADQERRKELLAAIADLQKKYHDEAQKYVDALAEIEARYAPRAVLIPKSTVTQ